ncbi:MAG: DoxX family membrane protein [Bacteroidales bacterium]|nr:DoxX family membrane protein [Bacteroidales bacterium]
MKDKILHIVVNICRLVVSATFIFSGVVKLIDPTGTQYKIEDYATALSIGFFLTAPIPLMLAVVMAMLEFCLGIYLFFGIRRHFTTVSILAFMAFYTPLTLWLAITDSVADCGCFGDAIVLTNWQTFFKNAVLLAAAVILLCYRRCIIRLISESVQWLISLFTIIFSGFLAGLCIYGEPIIDFRPFHIGQHIPTAMQWPTDPQETPEILDFFLAPIIGEDGHPLPSLDTDELLADTGYTFLLIAPHLEQADDTNMEHINALYDYAHENGYPFWCLTASDAKHVNRWRDLTGAEYGFTFADELTLKTMARSNPALILLHNGTINAKRGHRQLPQVTPDSGPLHTLSWAHPHPQSYQRLLLQLFLWYLIPLVTLTILDRSVSSFRWWYKRHKQ